MDLLQYAVFSGLERVAIIAGAVIIGYWGYRLYVNEKNAGLVFMGLACAVLVAALITGASQVNRISEGYQLASVEPVVPQLPEPAAEPMAAEAPLPVGQGADPSPFVDEAAPIDESAAEGRAEQAVPSEATLVEAPPADLEPVEPQPESEPLVRLVTGQELGGRIVSVQSENVSLQWSSTAEQTEQ